MRTAATSGKWDGTSACTALPGWRAQDSAVGAVRSVVLGVASDSASCMCAPPLLKKDSGGRRHVLDASERDAKRILEGTKEGLVGRHAHRGVSVAHSVRQYRKGGWPGGARVQPIAIHGLQPQGSAHDRPAHFRISSYVVLERLKWSY